VIIRGLTLWRPWDVAMRDLGKPIENRKWPPPDYMLGQLVALHSGKRWDDDGAMHIALHAHKALEDEDCPAGAITCVARITGIMQRGKSYWTDGSVTTNTTYTFWTDPSKTPPPGQGFPTQLELEKLLAGPSPVYVPSPLDLERWFFGPYGWLMPERVAIEPVPCRGAQGLWKLPPDVEAEVLRRYNESKGG
jgi:hypothetical protein